MRIEKDSESQVNVAEEPYWEPDEFEYEQLERYDHGGFCPVLIWQRFKNDRYCVVYKLGIGHFSTVWLARDLYKKRYVALKILTANQFNQSSEADMLRAVANSTESFSTGQKYLISLLDSFDHESANGTHHVLVFPISRPLVGLRSLNINFFDTVKSLVMGLDYLHAVGIIHGDIHISNIGYQIPNFSDEQLQSMVPPQSHIVPPLGERRPLYLISRQEWLLETFLDREYHGQIVPQILDFGAAFKFSEKKARLGKPVAMPEAYKPPEHVFDRENSGAADGLNYGELTKETDIWALGVTLFELATGQSLLRPRWGSSPWKPYLSFDDRVAPSWQINVNDVRQNDALSDDVITTFWDHVFQLIDKGPVYVGDKELFKQFILDMVCLDPARRLSTSALLQHKYLADVA